MSNPETNPDKRPLPDGWITEHSPQWNAWYYVDTKSQNPQAIWVHPLDGTASSPSPAYTTEPHTGHTTTSAPPAASGQPTNPDTRPLPPGFVSQYSPEHKTFFYVNESAPNPGATVTWKHPADEHNPPTDLKSPATASTQAHANPAISSSGAGGPPAPVSAHQNPDKRDLPSGWKTDYDENYKAWYYINTNDPASGASWTHPADTQGPSAIPPTSQPSGAGPSGAAASSYPGGVSEPHASAPAAGPNTSQKENPDKRPLPTGWITKYDENYGVWYYVDTTKPGSAASWEHPAGNASAAGHTSAPQGKHSAETPGVASPYGAPSNQPYGSQPQPGAAGPGGPGGGGIEGLLGGSAGKMIGGLFGSKGRAQMDTFANKLSPEVQKLKGKYGSSGQGQHGPAPPGQGPYSPAAGHGPAPGQGYGPPGQGYGPPGQGHGQATGYSGAPGQGQAPGQYQQNHAPGAPPPAGGQYPGQSHGGSGGGGMSLGNLGGMAGKFGGFLKK